MGNVKMLQKKQSLVVQDDTKIVEMVYDEADGKLFHGKPEVKLIVHNQSWTIGAYLMNNRNLLLGTRAATVVINTRDWQETSRVSHG